MNASVHEVSGAEDEARVKEENGSTLSRVTCGWKKPHLPLESVRRYWRDVHSPAISRRAGLYEYRHAQFDAVRGDLFAPTQRIEYACPPAEQLMWLSDVRYFDASGLAAFAESPDSTVRAHLLADIDILVDKSTTYRAVGDNAWTYRDDTGESAPAGPPQAPTYAIFFRQRAGDPNQAARDEPAFRECVRALAARWSATPHVRRLRLSIFDVPDMEAERKAGYPIKTHPVEQQYQALIDLTVDERLDTRLLMTTADADTLRTHIAAVHVYPVASLYTFVRGGRPTLIGLRGYPAYQAIQEFNADGQRQPALLEWMYGPVAARPPVGGDS